MFLFSHIHLLVIDKWWLFSDSLPARHFSQRTSPPNEIKLKQFKSRTNTSVKRKWFFFSLEIKWKKMENFIRWSPLINVIMVNHFNKWIVSLPSLLLSPFAWLTLWLIHAKANSLLAATVYAVKSQTNREFKEKYK